MAAPAAADSAAETPGESTFTPGTAVVAVILPGLAPCWDQEPSFRVIWSPSKEGWAGARSHPAEG